MKYQSEVVKLPEESAVEFKVLFKILEMKV